MRNTAWLAAGVVALAVVGVPASAGERALYCDGSGYHCYRIQRDEDQSRWRGEVPWYSRYDDDYDGGRHMVCDPDGDRCYLSRSWRWNYRQYYRLHGYRWDD